MHYVIMPVVVGLKITRDCVRSVLAQDVPDIHLIAIDNGSLDGCGPYLRSLPPARVTVLTYAPTVSLHRVWNHALGEVFDSHHAEHALVINNDVILSPDTYRLLEADGSAFVSGVGVDCPWDQSPRDLTSHSLHPTFSCFLIRHHVWSTIGRFDESYWAWAGDCDYHLRMHQADIVAYGLSLPFQHVNSATLKTVGPEDHLKLCRLSDQDRATFARKYGFAVGSPEYYEAFRLPHENAYTKKGALA